MFTVTFGRCSKSNSSPKLQAMKLFTLLITGALSILTSCNGQNTSQPTKYILKGPLAKGDTVKELGNNIMLVYQDKKNIFWFGSWGEGLYRYDGKTIIHFTTAHGLLQNKIVNIQEDRSGNLYFNTDIGINKFDGHTFSKLPIANTNEWKLQPDDLWFKGAQDSGVVYRYDGATLQAGDEHYAKLPRSKNPNANYSPYDVYTIYKDSKGSIWFGTTSLGVCRYDPRLPDGQGKSFLWISENELEFDEETGFGIRSIIQDNDGKYWFSNTLHRFKMLAGDNYEKENGIDIPGGKNNFDKVAIISMAKDKNDLWLVTYNQGVWRYNGERVTHYTVKDNGKDIKLFSIFKDNNGDLWLGTPENGAYKFNGKSFEKFRQ